MTYPKPVMSITELVAMGFTRDYLNRMAHRRGQKYCTKTLGGGKYMFDTEKFEKERQRLIR